MPAIWKKNVCHPGKGRTVLALKVSSETNGNGKGVRQWAIDLATERRHRTYPVSNNQPQPSSGVGKNGAQTNDGPSTVGPFEDVQHGRGRRQFLLFVDSACHFDEFFLKVLWGQGVSSDPLECPFGLFGPIMNEEPAFGAGPGQSHSHTE